MTKRVLVWDPLQTGHHPIWLKILIDTAPPGLELVVPDWLDSEGGRVATYRLEHPEYPSRSISRTLRQTACDVLLLPDLRPFSSSVAWRRIEAPAVIAVDHGSDHVRLLEEPLQSLGLRRSASALKHLVWRELLVRRQPVRIFSTNPDSPRIGSRRLRSATRHLPMPIETLQEVDASRWPRYARRLVLVGALQPRKGLEALVEALEILASRVDTRDLEVVVAGRPSTSYRRPAERLVSRLSEGGLEARFIDRFLGDDEYSALVDTADVVALPYDRFIGGSGIVGALMGRSTSVVVSNYGWLGRFAAERGAYTFPNRSIEGLAAALEQALSERRPLSLGGNAYLPKEEAMAGLWEAIRELP